MKKYLWFVGVFVVAFVVLQLAAGLIMTMLYTPSFLLEGGTSLQSEVVFGEASLIPPVVLALLALGLLISRQDWLPKSVYYIHNHLSTQEEPGPVMIWLLPLIDDFYFRISFY
ncbi:hypothetical protein [Halalkalibacterium halodurans]|uniref:hypothetical protein n=1 Tax=Halalkalibacterium halodurans TaxID=86665 RepID=UPI002AA9F500|nr:hypothetical protein [Halalkalibacterium halodurans]MDY7221227.1 hypothetical protein [Halalkalibacterium halodurans]MDY7240466.1 hypothetical protein [Halalkalibacterium halodurans]